MVTRYDYDGPWDDNIGYEVLNSSGAINPLLKYSYLNGGSTFTLASPAFGNPIKVIISNINATIVKQNGTFNLNSTTVTLIWTGSEWLPTTPQNFAYVPKTQQGTKLVGTGYTNVGTTYYGGFGNSVAVSGDGIVLATSNINDNNGVGAIWIFTRSGTVWTQQGAKLLGTGYSGLGQQGSSLAMSYDGNTLLVGAPNDFGGVGASWIFTRNGTVWTQQGSKLVGTGYSGPATQGTAVAIGGDSNTIGITGFYDLGSVNYYLGATWIFTRSGTVWTQQGAKLLGTGYSYASAPNNGQGNSIAISPNSNTLAIGSEYDQINAAGNIPVGATWLFTRNGTVWTQLGHKLIGTGYSGISTYGNKQGAGVAFGDNNTLASASLIDSKIGATWIFTRTGTSWTQQGPKLIGTGASSGNGISNNVRAGTISLSGNTLLIGGRDDNFTGGSDVGNTGAFWIFTRNGTVWTQQGTKLLGTGYSGNAGGPGANQGSGVALSANGDLAVIGGYNDNDYLGAVWVFY